MKQLHCTDIGTSTRVVIAIDIEALKTSHHPSFAQFPIDPKGVILRILALVCTLLLAIPPGVRSKI